MTRSSAIAQRVFLEAQDTPDAALAFLTMEHPNLPDPIRVVSDVMDYKVGAITFVGMPFGVKLLTDSEAVPRSQLVMQNVDRRIGNAVRRSLDRCKVKLEIRSSADFDLTKDPRVQLVAGSPIYAFSSFWLTNVQIDATQLTGDIELEDYSVEPWPSVRATKDRLPGLFR